MTEELGADARAVATPPEDTTSPEYWKYRYDALLHDVKNWGVIELAVRNFNLMDYMRHWEGRAEKAEGEVERLKHILTNAGLSSY